MTTPRELPELPGTPFMAPLLPGGGYCATYTAAQMHAYARQAIAESEARAVAAEANDRRYRWLRDPANNESVSNLIAIYDYGDEALLMDGDDLDAAIDAAIAQEAEREAGSA